jgi:hypothetical protein
MSCFLHPVVPVDQVVVSGRDFREDDWTRNVDCFKMGLIDGREFRMEIAHIYFHKGDICGLMSDVLKHFGDIELKNAVHEELVAFANRVRTETVVCLQFSNHVNLFLAA